MKSQPACVTLEEEDPATGESKPDTRTTAAIFLPAEESYQRRRERRKSDKKLTIDGKSELLGSIGDAMKNNLGHESLNLLMGEHEDDPDFRILLESQYMKHKIFYMPDKVINIDVSTLIEREIPISKTDLSHESPKFLIAQKTYMNDRPDFKVYKLFFNTKIVLDQPYVFPGLGDEIGGVGCPDLHCIFRPINDWDSMERRADLSTFDRDERITVTKADVYSKKQLVYDITESKIVVQNGLKSNYGISISCAELFPEALAAQPNKVELEDMYPSPPSKKRKSEQSGESGCVEKFAARKVCVKLIGMGPKIEGGELRADLNLKFVLED